MRDILPRNYRSRPRGDDRRNNCARRRLKYIHFLDVIIYRFTNVRDVQFKRENKTSLTPSTRVSTRETRLN